MRISYYLAIPVFCVAIALAAGLFLIRMQLINLGNQQQGTQSGYAAYINSNPTLLQATSLELQGQYSQARDKVQNVLNQTTNPSMQGILSFWSAKDQELTGDYMGALSTLEGTASNLNYDSTIRAAAIQQIGLMYSSYHDSKITDSVFKEPLFAPLFVSGDVAVSYRNLFEYSTSLFPYVPAELAIASWYSGQLAEGAATSSEVRAQYKQIIAANLSYADQVIASGGFSSDPTKEAYLPIVLLFKANILADMSIAGDTSLGDPSAAFQSTFNTLALSSGSLTSDYAYLSYASFLYRKYGVTRTANIKQALAPLYQQNSDVWQNFMFQQFLENERMDSGTGSQRPYIQKLASVDPNFKKLLTAYGWTSADF